MTIQVYTLSTCSTSKKILSEAGLNNQNAIIQDIKTNPITIKQLELMHTFCGSYDSLFSKRSQKYKNVKPEFGELSEEQCKALILQEYTFLKRPVIIVNGKIFIGNSAQNVAQLKQEITLIIA